MRDLTKIEEQILLAINYLGSQAYLVTIREKLHDMTGKYLDVGTIYVPLKRLFREGLLDTALGDPSTKRGGKAIKYYKITKKGYEVLTDLKKAHDRMWEGFLYWDI